VRQQFDLAALSQEGARGQEFNAWGDPTNPPEHTVILPFTRMLAGPMDFTPGIMDVLHGKTELTRRGQSTIAVPTDWETSETLHGQIGDYIVVTRRPRGGKDWFLGALTVEKKVVTAKDSLDFDMAAGGGTAVRFRALD
jgi:alpha-glucosidase